MVCSKFRHLLSFFFFIFNRRYTTKCIYCQLNASQLNKSVKLLNDSVHCIKKFFFHTLFHFTVVSEENPFDIDDKLMEVDENPGEEQDGSEEGGDEMTDEQQEGQMEEHGEDEKSEEKEGAEKSEDQEPETDERGENEGEEDKEEKNEGQEEGQEEDKSIPADQGQKPKVCCSKVNNKEMCRGKRLNKA